MSLIEAHFNLLYLIVIHLINVLLLNPQQLNF
jgi:hypothetical protein